MAIGVSFFGYVMGTISTLVTNLNVSAALYEKRMTIVKEYIFSRQIPKHMGKKIRDHFEYYYLNHSVFKERRILERLPSALRNELIHHVYTKLVANVKYFAKCHESLVSDIVMLMHPCSVLKNEFVYVQHEIAAHVFFVLKGKVLISRTLPGAKGDVKIGSHMLGEHFGEMEVYDHDHGNGVRMCSAVAKSFCELMFLSRESILKLSASCSNRLQRCAGASSAEGDVYSLFREHETATAMVRASMLVKKNAYVVPLQRASTRISPFVSDDATHESPTAGSEVAPGAASRVDSLPMVITPTLKKQPLFLRQPTIPFADLRTDSVLRKSDNDSEGHDDNRSQDDAACGNETRRSVKAKSEHIEQESEAAVEAPQRRNSTQSPAAAGVQKPNQYSVLSTSGTVRRDLQSMVEKFRSTTSTPMAQQNIIAELLLLKGTYLFHPQQPFIVSWQFVIGVAILYSIVVVPLRLGFSYDAVGGWFVLELVIDGFFFVDIFLSFRTAFVNDEKVLVYNARAIRRKYVRGWFVPDLISTIPFDDIVSLLMGASDDEVHLFPTKLLRLTRVARLLKLTRFVKLSRVFGKIRDIIQISPWAERLWRLMFMMSLFCHWNACLFHAAMLMGEGEKLLTWCDIAFPDVRPGSASCSETVPLFDRYVAAMYWAFTTLTTVGYGDIRPSVYSVYELALVVALIVVNATFFGFIVSSVMDLIQNFDPSDREYKLLMTEMKDYMRESSASARLSSIVKVHYKHNVTCTSLFPEKKIFDKLSPSLRFDIARLVAGETLFAIPLITVMEDAFKGFVSYALFQFKPMCIVRSEKVCRCGGPGTEMFFLVEGECDLLNSHTNVGRVIGENSVFEQYALMARPEEVYRTVSTVTALTTKCVLYSFAIQDFRDLEAVSPAVSTYFLSQLAAVLIEDDLFALSPVQTANVKRALRGGRVFRSVAEHHQRTQLNTLGKVALAKLYPRRGSEWSPDLLPRQLKLMSDKDNDSNAFGPPTDAASRLPVASVVSSVQAALPPVLCRGGSKVQPLLNSVRGRSGKPDDSDDDEGDGRQEELSRDTGTRNSELPTR
ncbi:hypothetical protein PybrP1_010121 [[Pythium] brassicae (nom. inval.)]|nr:hypothetical protein PybrP1_010121 [[Pythium] brassicae (nom. inval.)]